MKLSGEEYDAIVVGSGCTGGTAAMVLSEQGMRVLVLEAGREITPDMTAVLPISEFSRAKRFWRGFISKSQDVQSSHPGYWTQNPDLFVNDKLNPYSYPEDKKFIWIRGRQVGGRSHTWGGVALRWSKRDFEMPERDGYGKWPLRYEDLVVHYEKMERVLRVGGTSYNLENYPDGIFESVKGLTPGEIQFDKKVQAAWPGRRLLLSRGMSGFPAKNGNLWPARSSLATTLAVALASGKVTIKSEMAVRNIDFDPVTKMATGVLAVDCATGNEIRLKARVVVLCASTIESVRILLNSSGPAHPDGPGNQSGMLGRCLMDHMTRRRFFLFPYKGRDYKVVHPIGGANTVWIPSWINREKQDYNFTGSVGIWGGIQRAFQPIKKEGFVGGMMSTLAEMMPNPENRVEIDRDQKDAWGIPTVKVTCSYFDNDLKLQQFSEQVLDELIGLSGSTIRGSFFKNPIAKIAFKKIDEGGRAPGWYIHEVGGARMGDSPGNSVVNSFCQVWGAPNLLVTDGSCWPTQGWQSPSLTMMAITSRACANIIDEFKKKNI